MRGGYGGMVTVILDGVLERTKRVLEQVQVFTLAESLGGVESLIEHRSSVEGPTSPVPGDLLRLSVGIEDADDLVNDLETALRLSK